MWDPSSYLDTDFGLDAGERFEPAGGEDWEDVDTTLPHVRTVLGPIPIDSLGVCLPFESLISNNSQPAMGPGHLLPARDSQVITELEMFFMSGGRSVVNASTVTADDSAGRLQAIARRVPVHVLSAYPLDAADRADDSSQGSRGSADEKAIPDWVGLLSIDEIVTTPGPGLLELQTSVARIQRQSGLPVIVRCDVDDATRFVTEVAQRDGRPLRIIVVSPPGQVGHGQRLCELANLGAWIGFDGLGVHGQEFDALVAHQCVSLMQAGFADRILLSPGLSEPSQFVSQGGHPGWTYLLEHFSLALMAAGAEALAIRSLLVENPANALAVFPECTQ